MNTCKYPRFKTLISLLESLTSYSYSRLDTGYAILSDNTVNSSLSSNCLLPVNAFNVYLLFDGYCTFVPSILKSASTIKSGGN